jgi:leader peptidase (prepilin peptidase)/N-methyltransferase
MVALFNLIPIYTAIFSLAAAGFIMNFIRTLGNYFLQKETLGLGDIKLGGIIGFYLGWYGFMLALLIGSLLAILIYGIQLLLASEEIDTRIPLGPHLSAGAMIVLLYL